MATENTVTGAKTNYSIHPKGRGQGNPNQRRTPAQLNRVRQDRHRVNQAARAGFYAQHQGGDRWQKDVQGWHQTIKGLSLGTGA